MNIWGKIIGAVSGYALHGPEGAIVGAIAGHFIDMYTAWAESHVANPINPDQPGSERRNAGTRYTFTLCVVTLGAKLAKVDGTVSKAEIAAFKEVFRVPADELKNVATIFDRARATAQGYESFAQKLAKNLKDNYNTLDEVVSCLFHVALADGPLRPEETQFIYTVAKIFGFSDSYFQRRMEDQVHQSGHHNRSFNQNGSQGRQQRGPAPERPVNPYDLLGVHESNTDQEIKIRYRKLVRENHPDVVAAGKTKADVAQATAKLARINAAYDQIQKERQL